MSRVTTKANVNDATDLTFAESIGRTDVPTLVDFWAPWCGPCRLLAPILDRAADEYVGRIQVLRVNVDENPSLSARYGIRSIPTLVLFRDGEPAARMVGAVPLADIRTVLDQALARTETAGGA